MNSQDTPVYLGTTLGDVQLYKTNHTVHEAKITQLFYFLKQEDDIVARYDCCLRFDRPSYYPHFLCHPLSHVIRVVAHKRDLIFLFDLYQLYLSNR